MVTKKVLALTPHITPWGVCIYQGWTPGFDPDYPAGLLIPTWISLVKLPHEYKPIEGYLASTIGPIYTVDQANATLRDPRFCVGLDVSDGWPSALKIPGLLGRDISVLINYEHAPVRCRFCFSLNHRVPDYMALKLNSVEPNSPGETHHSPSNIGKGKSMPNPVIPTQRQPPNQQHAFEAIVTPMNKTGQNNPQLNQNPNRSPQVHKSLSAMATFQEQGASEP
jgi:hypothetical protein